MHTNLKNYRPIAKLKFVAKLIERACAAQVHAYISLLTVSMVNPNLHIGGTTAMLRIFNDLLLGLDKGQ